MISRANQRWSIDFMSDQLGNGRRFRIFNIVDDFTRECPGQIVDFSISGARVAYTEMLKDSGILIISGFYHEDIREITDSAKSVGFRSLDRISQNDWAACVYRYNSEN